MITFYFVSDFYARIVNNNALTFHGLSYRISYNLRHFWQPGMGAKAFNL
jgi:hypothetical protein